MFQGREALRVQGWEGKVERQGSGQTGGYHRGWRWVVSLPEEPSTEEILRAQRGPRVFQQEGQGPVFEL